MTFLAIAVLWLMPMVWWISLPASTFILLMQYFTMRRKVWLLSRQSVVSFRLEPDGIVLILVSGNEQAGQLATSTFITPYLTILNVRVKPRRGVRSVVIFPDSIDAEDFRRLRVLLRWNKVCLS